MISGIITYLIIGVVFNFVFDLLVNVSGDENHRFTMFERFTMTLIWPIGIIMFAVHFFKQFISNK
jgi:hypothetical protein